MSCTTFSPTRLAALRGRGGEWGERGREAKTSIEDGEEGGGRDGGKDEEGEKEKEGQRW